MTANWQKFLVTAVLLASSASWTHPGAKVEWERISAAVRANPQSSLPLLARAHLAIEEAAYAAALEDLRRVEALGNPLEAAADLGNLFYHMQDYAAAQAALTRYLSHYPNHAQSLRLRAMTRVKLNAPAAAVQDFLAYLELARQLDPSDFLQPAKLLVAAGDDGVPQALALVNRGLEVIGSTPQLQRYAIELELMLGNSEGALDRWQSLADTMQHSPEWSLTMADLYFRSGDAKQAMVLLDRASSRLQELRVTPARKKLARRIELARAAPTNQY